LVKDDAVPDGHHILRYDELVEGERHFFGLLQGSCSVSQ